MPPFTQLIAQIKSMMRGYAPILKYDRNQPRNPKGSGREGGRWTKGGVSQGLHGEDASTAHGLSAFQRRTRATGDAGFDTMQKARHEDSSSWDSPATSTKPSGASDESFQPITMYHPRQRTPAGVDFADVLLNVPKGGRGYSNRPRLTGDPEMVARMTKPTSTGGDPVMEGLKTGTIVREKALDPGQHANDAFKVQLSDGSLAVAKPNRGEYVPREGKRRFGNGDIDRCLTNKDLSLGEREAMAYEFQAAAKLNFTPRTVYREDVDGMPKSSKNPRAPKNGGSLQEWVDGLNAGETDATPEEIRKMAVFEYAVGSMDHHSTNIFYDADGKLLAMDNGYSFPDPGEPGAAGPDADEYVDAEMQKLWEVHVGKAEKRAGEIKEIWDDLVGEHAQTIGAAVAAQAHPVFPMGSKPEFHRKEPTEIDMNDVLKEAGVDVDSGPLDEAEKAHVREILSQKIAEGATVLSGFSKTGFREDEQTAWFDEHADTKAQFRDDFVQDNGGDEDYDDKGQSQPTGEPDGFQFRANMVDDWRNSAFDINMPESERKPIREALEATDWNAFCDRHPNMSAGERKAFLGRIERLKQALKTEKGLYKLWESQSIIN